MEFSHKSVLLDECIDALAIRPDGIYLDGTLGGAGHTSEIYKRLGEGGMVQLDEERKAAMVSNLLVVLCGNQDAQPVVNSGSLY